MRHMFMSICFMACYISGQTVHQHWIEKAHKLQPTQGPAVYWLLHPNYNDWSLIQMTSSQHKQPSYTQTGPNFSYVDPTYTHSGGKLHRLPKGLAYWHSDRIMNTSAQAIAPRYNVVKNAHVVRNFPFGQPFAESMQKNNPYISLKNGNLWSPQQASAVKIPTHIVTQPPSRNAKDITVVTSNTLAEAPYSKHATTDRMPLKVRQHFWKTALRNPYIFYDADIICVQEWDQRLARGMSGYGYVGAQIQNGMTSGIFYDKNRWYLHTSKQIAFGGKPQDCRVATLTDAQRNTTVTIASCHLPSRRKESESHNDIQRVLAEAHKQARTYNSHIIMAGDFNYNTYHAHMASYPARGNTKSTNGLRNTMQPLYDVATQHTTPAGHNASDIPTAYDNGFTRMDYIWATPDMQCTQYRSFPDFQSLSQVIKHTKAANMPDYGYHFSDHATLRATFKIPHQKASSWQSSLRTTYNYTASLAENL